MIRIVRYSAREHARIWDEFVEKSRNATFLFKRGYMDYHALRFADHSLLAFSEKGKLLALLPACAEADTLYSHRGLTYGSWLLPDRRCDALDMLAIWEEMTLYLRREGFRHLVYKTIPYIYSRRPAQEDRYALFRSGARLTGSLISSVIDLTDPLPMDQGSRQRSRKALDAPGLRFAESDRWADFWKLLEELLRARYEANPVHSLSEITLLKNRFPANIRLFTVCGEEGEMLAGVVIYICGSVAHSQYTAASPEGKRLSVLPGLYSFIMEKCAAEGIRLFDFGTSNEDGGKKVNEGLLRQKCSYGGRGVVYETFTLDL